MYIGILISICCEYNTCFFGHSLPRITTYFPDIKYTSTSTLKPILSPKREEIGWLIDFFSTSYMPYGGIKDRHSVTKTLKILELGMFLRKIDNTPFLIQRNWDP